MATEAKTPGAQGHGWNVSDTAVLCCSVWCWICIQIECELISVSMVCRISVNTFCIEPNEMQQKHWEINSWIKLVNFSFLLWKRKRKRFTHRTRLINLNKISQMHGICFVWSTRCDANQTKPNQYYLLQVHCSTDLVHFAIGIKFISRAQGPFIYHQHKCTQIGWGERSQSEKKKPLSTMWKIRISSAIAMENRSQKKNIECKLKC